MSFDFSKMGGAGKKDVPIDPIRIFETLPSLDGTPNDLWRGQAKALSEWHEHRKKLDVLVSLNTGAGKTIAGLLIAQSLVNEGLENVVYVCSTIDLVNQTAKEAEKIGLKFTSRLRGSYSNTLFESGKAFCITTYAAMFNGYSSIRNRHFPDAIIFDDAHVAEALLRDSFTIRVNAFEHKDLFAEIAELFEPEFVAINQKSRFSNATDPEQHSTILVPPGGLLRRLERLKATLDTHDVANHDDFKYPYAWLQDNLHCCAALFSQGNFELSPPFLPSLALDIFEQRVRRVYLSATLQSPTEFIRAFGRLPKITIEPSVDAGNGERLILGSEGIAGGFGPKFGEKLVEDHKVVMAVPDYRSAARWTDIGQLPELEDFSDELEDFRNSEEGGFILVSRVDGIDLPHDTCRVMIVDGLPSGMSLLERYQWEFLRMKNVHAVRVANRLAQLFGRSNRGRNDYGAFLLEGSDVNKWLANDRNLTLLPPLLQKQILLGREIRASGQLPDKKAARKLVKVVLDRDKGWLNYYENEVKLGELDQEKVARAAEAEPALIQAALSEAEYARGMWGNDPTEARRALEKTVDRTASADTPLGGWHALWLGAAFEAEGDEDSALREYAKAMKRLGRSLVLPRKAASESSEESAELNSFGSSLWNLLSLTSGAKFETQFSKLKAEMAWIDSGSSTQAEAGTRALGEVLGFTSTRPDNDEDIGPDALWVDESTKQMFGFELKTDKGSPAKYTKDDTGQCFNHLQWMGERYGDCNSLGLVLVGPDGAATKNASPSGDITLCLTEHLAALRDEIVALIDDLRKRTPIERRIAIKDETSRDRWSLESLAARLKSKEL